jgi:putative sterol carrier protein
MTVGADRSPGLALRVMGRIYADAEQLEQVYSAMFESVAEDASMRTMVDSQMVINFRLHDPDADIWVDGRSSPVVTTFEPIEDVRATLTATLSADSMHELLLGTLPLGRALLFRKLKVSGSKTKAMGLEPLLHACQAVYPDIAAEQLG